MRWVVILGGLVLVAFGAFALAVHKQAAEAQERYGPAQARVVERVYRELQLSATVREDYQKSWRNDLERLDITVEIPFVPPTLDAQAVRRQVESIVREEFAGAPLFSVQVPMARRGR
jgi:hypothetical protein